ncbi:MAG: MFS transporter [Hyphomonadaceae bacterium]
MDAQTAPVRRVPLQTKIVFAMGSAAEMIALTSVGGFALFYYNQVLGMSATMAGLAMSISLLFDGLADPLIGSLSDRTRHKLGRRHPYLYMAPIPIAISLIGVFNPPAGMPHLWLFFWFTAFVLSLRVFMAMYHTPHLAMVAEMSPDYTERSRILSWNTLFSFAGRSGTTFVALSLFFHKTEEYPRGLLNPDAYAPFAYTGAGLCVALLLASAWFTRDQIPRMRHVPDHIKPFSFVEFFKDVGAAVSNRNYFFLLIGLFFISLTTGLTVSLALYINTYLWQLPSEQIRWLEAGTLIGFVLGFFVTAKFHDRFGKRTALVVCSSVSSASYSIPIVLWLTGLLPVQSNPYLMPILIACAALTALAGCGMTISGMSAMADIADENELRIGRRQEAYFIPHARCSRSSILRSASSSPAWRSTSYTFRARRRRAPWNSTPWCSSPGSTVRSQRSQA